MPDRSVRNRYRSLFIVIVSIIIIVIMVHIPSAYTYNFWSEKPEPTVVELTFLMPNGVVIPVEINRNSTVTEIKEVNIFPNA